MTRVAELGEALDAHRKQRQAQFPWLTMTGMYNVLEMLRSGEPITGKSADILAAGDVARLRDIHDELDAAVLRAYGWGDLIPLLRITHGNEPATASERAAAKEKFNEEVLARLVALNAERAEEEARGHVRWLRPEYQIPLSRNPNYDPTPADTLPLFPASPQESKRPWPVARVEQVVAVRSVLDSTPRTADDVCRHFQRAPKTVVLRILAAQELAGISVDVGDRWVAA